MSVFMPRFGPIQAILFDLDGTLIDSAPDLAAAAEKMRLDRGLPSLPTRLYRPMSGSGARGMIAVAFGLAPEDAGFAALKDEFYFNYARCMTQRTSVFEGVQSLVVQLRDRNLAWGVVTNKAERFTGPLTRSMPLFESAAVVISGDTTPHTKPHPEPLLEAARRLGLEPARCVYVGDDARDIVAGRAAGMGTVAANYGYLGKLADTALWGAHATIKSPLELLQLLEEA